MAEVPKQYNLRSSKTDPTHLPVQLQLSDDSQFMAQLVKQQENSVQVSDSDSSDSELNCSDLVQSDHETNNTKIQMFLMLLPIFLTSKVLVLACHKTL